MKKIGMDISMRCSGIVCISEHLIEYYTIKTNSKTLNNEELLIHIWNEICKIITRFEPDIINLEALSLNSISREKDIIDGLHWYIRTNLKLYFPSIRLNIVEVKSWREELFTKEERKQLKEFKTKLKEVQQQIKNCASKIDKQLLLMDNEDVILNSNIKYLTWLKLPEPLKSEFKKLGFNGGCFDLTDAYFIAKWEKHEKI